MSTFLELAQKTRRECGATSGPSGVTGQTGQLEKFVAWTNDGWKDIQRRHNNWRWMRSRFSFETTSGDDTYAYTDCDDERTGTTIARFGRWILNEDTDRPSVYLTASGVAAQTWLVYLPLDEFRYYYKHGAQQTQTGQPFHITVDEVNNLLLGPKPNDAYTIIGPYQRGVQSLEADADEPDMPEDFHDLIVYQAMMKYGANSVAPEVLARSRVEGGRMMRALEANQLPPPEMAGPLA